MRGGPPINRLQVQRERTEDLRRGTGVLPQETVVREHHKGIPEKLGARWRASTALCSNERLA